MKGSMGQGWQGRFLVWLSYRMTLLFAGGVLMASGEIHKKPVPVAAAKTAAKTNKKVAPQDDVVNVQTKPITRKTFIEHGAFLGSVRGIEQTTLFSPLGGIVGALYVKDGEVVTRGKALCNINGERLRLMRESAEIDEKLAQDTYTRLRRHRQRGSSSKLQVDQAKNGVLKAKIRRLQAVENYEGAFCISPIDGIVVTHHVEAHQRVAPMRPTLTIAQLDRVAITLSIPENQISGYRVDNPVTFAKGLATNGKIYAISQAIDTKTRHFSVEVHAANVQGHLRPGQSIWLKVLRRRMEGQIVIPSNAIITLQDRQVVMVMEAGKARRKTVLVSATNEKEALITKGLTPGDQLIIEGHYQATDGARVRVVNPVADVGQNIQGH